MNFGSIAAVFWFEWKRSLTLARLGWWLVLALFPGLIVGMIRATLPRPIPEPEPWMIMLFGLVPMLVTMLGTFLWATPVISAELERKSWVYLAVRPNGKVNVLLGKYLAAVTWSLSAALVSLLIAVLIMPNPEAVRIGWVIARITLLSCPAYAAVYLLIGILFPKRSMVIAVAYSLVFELIISLIPAAVINTFTVQYRIRTLLYYWGEMDGVSKMDDFLQFIGDPPAWEHAMILVVYTLVLIVAAVGIVRGREFSTAEEGEA
jgi:ABC-type transport system involved in multi-copper enzyme maturation permease subunit